VVLIPTFIGSLLQKAFQFSHDVRWLASQPWRHTPRCT